jgi:hypothetical protein
MKKLTSLIIEAALVVGAATLGVVGAFAHPGDPQQTSTHKTKKPPNPKLVKPNPIKVNTPANNGGSHVDVPPTFSNKGASGSGAGKVDKNVVSIGNNQMNKSDPSTSSNNHDWGKGKPVLVPSKSRVDLATVNATGKRNPGGGNTTVKSNTGEKLANPRNATSTKTDSKDPRKVTTRTTDTADKEKGRK